MTTNYKANADNILKELKLIIFDSNIPREMVDFGVKVTNESVNYFIKLKNTEKYVLIGATRNNYIPKTQIVRLEEILNNFAELDKYEDKVDISSLTTYNEAKSFHGKNLYLQGVVPLKENPNILFSPKLELLYFSKKIKLSGSQLVSQELELDFYEENVTVENFELKANELIKIFEEPISNIVNISVVAE